MNDNDKIAEDYREKTANLRRIMFGGSDNHLSYSIREMEREQCEREQKKFDNEFQLGCPSRIKQLNAKKGF